jgi:hypothetical protein
MAMTSPPPSSSVVLTIQAYVCTKNTVSHGIWLNGDHPGCAKVHSRKPYMVPHIGSNVQEDPGTKRVFNVSSSSCL